MKDMYWIAVIIFCGLSAYMGYDYTKASITEDLEALGFTRIYQTGWHCEAAK